MAQPASEADRSGLVWRLASAIALAPPVLAAVWFGSPYFEIMVAFCAVVLIWEWNAITRGASNPLAWRVSGLLWIGLPCLALVWLRSDPEWGRETVVWLMVLVWATDVGAYAAGRTIGGPKLAPRISPNKTWAGLVGGGFAAALVGVGAALLLEKDAWLPLAMVSGLLGAFSQAGDLMESWVKRRFGVKDSSRIIPGHGGLFDRVDGLLAAAAGIVLINWSIGGKVLEWL